MFKKISEEDLQKECVKYLYSLREKGIRIEFTAIPNSTYTTSWSAKSKNIKMGLRGGLPDLFLICNGKALFIELKTKTGVLSDKQKKWHEAINASEGLICIVVRDINTFKSVIQKLFIKNN